jgi:glyoxylase-like metal-dependent hydrolase (beta-lactamase superfamily II)
MFDERTNKTTGGCSMLHLARRALLAGGAAALAAGRAPAHAAAPLAGRQAASFYRYKVGSTEVTVVSDGVGRLPVTDAFVLNASSAEVNAALRDAFMEPGIFYGPYNPIVVNTGAKLVVMDTGTGEAALAATKGATGYFMANLVAAGIDRNDVDAVVISHYHGDHINGLLRPDGALAFPNAEVLVPAREHAYWTDEAERGRAQTQRIRENFDNVRRVLNPEVMKRLRTYEADHDVIPGLRAVSTPGHTPGHVSHVLSSGAASVFVQADVTHAPFLFARHPGWHSFYDHDAEMAEATRRRVYDMLAAERMTVQGFHYPFPSVAHVEKTASGYQEVPTPWNTALPAG